MLLIRLIVDIYQSDFHVDILAKVLYLQELLYKWDLEKDGEQYSTSFCTEFRWASCWHSHLSRSAIFSKFYHWTLKPLNNHNIYKIHAHKLQGRISRGNKKRACGRHIDHGVVGGTLKSMSIHTNHLYWFNKWQCIISTSNFRKHQICTRTYPMRG